MGLWRPLVMVGRQRHQTTNSLYGDRDNATKRQGIPTGLHNNETHT